MRNMHEKKNSARSPGRWLSEGPAEGEHQNGRVSCGHRTPREWQTDEIVDPHFHTTNTCRLLSIEQHAIFHTSPWSKTQLLGPTAPKSDQGFDTKWTDEILAKNFVQPLPILSHLLAGIEEHAEESEDSENEGSMGNVTRVVMRPAGHSGKAKKGNLGFVDLISQHEYDLFIRPDTCNPRVRMSFNFTVENSKPDQRVIMNIINFSKKRNCFLYGMTPIVKSTSRPIWYEKTVCEYFMSNFVRVDSRSDVRWVQSIMFFNNLASWWRIREG
ncbi:unnamed protein product [Nesidiocoris tenuis]|uniref:Uncharacterized protein n=1 Tax=Nesidiocoris tenuis TaxID=355587 RepID=A0A6H5G2R9_9HEMI|nr:unnamed protein product [Nesidiocoris tenuis]